MDYIEAQKDSRPIIVFGLAESTILEKGWEKFARWCEKDNSVFVARDWAATQSTGVVLMHDSLLCGVDMKFRVDALVVIYTNEDALNAEETLQKLGRGSRARGVY